MDPIKIGIGVSSVGRFLPLIAQAAGLFERDKLPVEIVNQRNEERAVPDIVSGATPIGTPNAPSLVFSVLDGSDLVIVAGTTALFGYIIDWALRARGEAGQLIEVNPEETSLSQFATKSFREPAGIALPRLVHELLSNVSA